MTSRRLAAVVLLALAVSSRSDLHAQGAAACSKAWLGKEAEIEAFLASAKVTRLEAVPTGVTKPQRGYLEPGPVARFAWKQLPPARRAGYMESYKAEIAAYQLDRLLEMQMVPPVVERTVEGKIGAAVLWIEDTRSWDMKKPVQGPEPGWSKQISRMKLFDQLIGNIDRNQGNLIYDTDWHLFLIDHSRAFTTRKSLDGIAPLVTIDAELWQRIEALTAADLDRALGAWLTADQQEALFARREKMQQAVAKLVKDKGAASVFLR
ncbi:MAG: hypothetical protein AB7H93_11325 [Vicinamibacterales bacterium]